MAAAGAVETAGGRPFRAATAALQPYNAGLSAEHVRRRYGVADVVKLASNENPFGASPAVAASLADGLGSVALYPDPHCTALRTAIAGRLAVAPDRLVFGNGSEDLVGILCRAFLDPGDRVVLSSPTFSIYADFAAVMGAAVVDVPRRADFGLDVPAVRRALVPETRLLFLCNPNNPSGTMIPRADFEAIGRAAGPGTVIVADEAYYEYARPEADYPDSLAALPGVAAPWLVLRTFSKAYGLAGLRIGYGIASSPEVARQIDMVRTAFNVNRLAQAAALAAWGDTAHVEKTVAHNSIERARVAASLRRAGLAPSASAANFLFVDVGRNAREVAERLLAEGVIVKAWAGAFASFIRVSIGTAAENDRFLAALDRALRGAA